MQNILYNQGLKQNNILLETLPEAGKTDTQQVEVHQRGEGGKECG